MALKVLIPANQNIVTVSGLYQWDYGQVLEIECLELGSEIMEVHFACHGMTEAVVRPCTFANGVGTVTIPDRCLEQASNITAWVYKINGTQGHTVKTITLPVMARTRPSKTQDMPVEYIDKYAEALTEINEAVEAFEAGNVTVAKALKADEATHAATAESAVNATNASSARHATSAALATRATTALNAENADKADLAESANTLNVPIKSPDCTVQITNGIGYTTSTLDFGVYLVVYIDDNNSISSGVGYIEENNGLPIHCFISLGKIAVCYCEENNRSEVGLIYCGGDNNDPVISNNGSLRFFKIGTIPESTTASTVDE